MPTIAAWPRGRVGKAMGACALCLGVLAPPAPAQSPGQPEFVLSISAGSLRGDRVWRLPLQPAWAPAGRRDTLALSRWLVSPSVVVAVAATRFRSSLVGTTVEAMYLGFVATSGCAALGGFAPDSLQRNERACAGLQGRRTGNGALALQGGLTLRSNAGSGSHFFVRALAGAAYLGRSMVPMSAEVEGAATDSSGAPIPMRVDLLGERKSIAFTWIATMAAGARIAMSADYSASVQVSDVVIGLPVPAAAADVPPASQPGSPLAPVARRRFHFPTMAVSIDFVFGRGRQRRY